MFVPTSSASSATRRRRVLGVLFAALALLLTACADFPDQSAPTDWQPQRSLPPESGPEPQLPGQNSAAPGQQAQPSPPASIPPPQGCEDFDPAVIATCLNEVAAVAALPGSESEPSGFAAERVSGKVLRVRKDADPKQVAKLDVDAAGDGGLTGIALSPTYTEDQIVYAYITTGSDNRVVRFTPGDVPKPVITGIPKGATHNRGALAIDHSGALLVATGDADKPLQAGNPGSMAGKVLRVNGDGSPAPGNPNPGSAVIASGLRSPGGLCNSADGTRSWVTDQGGGEDRLYRLTGGVLGPPAWTWRDSPGVAGCASFSDSVLVAASKEGNIQSLSLNPDGSFSGRPQVTMGGTKGYGRISGVDIIGDAGAMAGTVNRAGGKPVSSDDRVVVIVPQSGAGGGKD
jgi:glucose/arabinose dehydrogenase